MSANRKAPARTAGEGNRTSDPTAKLPVNVGGDTGTGKGGVLGEATLTFTPGGVYVDVKLGDVEVPTIGFDRAQLAKALLAQNMAELFGGEVKEDGSVTIAPGLGA